MHHHRPLDRPRGQVGADPLVQRDQPIEAAVEVADGVDPPAGRQDGGRGHRVSHAAGRYRLGRWEGSARVPPGGETRFSALTALGSGSPRRHIPAMDAIRVENLTKRYGTTLAVDAIGFRVPVGATIGLLGGNGAGKTTTIAMLLGLLIRPTAPSTCSATTWRATVLPPSPG